VLGLVHQGKDVVLVALRLPAYLLGALESARPTFVDAGSHSRFKHLADSPRAKSKRTWGWTADLQKFGEGKNVIDGCRERVMRPPIQTDLVDGTLEFLALGSVRVPRGDVLGTNDRQFVNRLMMGHTLATIQARLVML
jgi:hypothetical protein